MIRLSNLSKRYPGGFDALRGVSFEVDSGEMVFITGHSGAGKSTLLKILTLIEHASGGQVVVNSRNVARLPRRDIPHFRREIGVVFQDNKLLHDRTVFDNVALPLIVAGVSHQEIARRTRAALDKVGLLGKERMYPVTLSGGEQQRVGIARAVVNKPALLLADEPTGNLDADMADQITDLFHDFNRHGVCVLIATHDLRQIQRLRKRVIGLKDGQLVVDSGNQAA
ncbi:MAG: cell division ATP-binding protein FtsE [Pseudomonadota bacterium]|nr:cell division ATP-binding protein FtsE [Pseudomonadota bacterium]